MVAIGGAGHDVTGGGGGAAKVQEQNSQLRPAKAPEPGAEGGQQRQADHFYQARTQGHLAAFAQRRQRQRAADADQRQGQSHLGKVFGRGFEPVRQADLPIGQRRGHDHTDDQRVADHAFADAPGIGLDHRAVDRQHDGRQGVVEQDHQRRENRPQGNPVIAIHARRQRQADHTVVAAKRALGIDATVLTRTPPDRPAPGHGKAHQGGNGEIDQQVRLQCRMEIGMQDAEEQQRRHGDVEHQGRGDVNEVVVDPVNALEQCPQKQHGKHRRGDVQGFEENCQHAGDLEKGVVRWLMIATNDVGVW